MKRFTAFAVGFLLLTPLFANAQTTSNTALISLFEQLVQVLLQEIASIEAQQNAQVAGTTQPVIPNSPVEIVSTVTPTQNNQPIFGSVTATTTVQAPTCMPNLALQLKNQALSFNYSGCLMDLMIPVTWYIADTNGNQLSGTSTLSTNVANYEGPISGPYTGIVGTIQLPSLSQDWWGNTWGTNGYKEYVSSTTPLEAVVKVGATLSTVEIQ